MNVKEVVLKEVMKFKYIEVMISVGGDMREEVIDRLLDWDENREDMGVVVKRENDNLIKVFMRVVAQLGKRWIDSVSEYFK